MLSLYQQQIVDEAKKWYDHAVGLMRDAGLFGPHADDIEACWKVGVRTEQVLCDMRDEQGRPVFDPSRRAPKLLGLPVVFIAAEGIGLDARPKWRPNAMIHTDRIPDAAAEIRQVFGARLPELIAALTAEAG